MVVIFCDASFNDETKKCGCGIVIKQLIYGGTKEIRIKVSDYAVDNNDAELKAIMHGLRHVDKPNPEAINIVTDSIVAIDELKKAIYRGDSSVENVNPKYQNTVKMIIHELAGERVRLYHCKGHTNKKQRYYQMQAICDRMAKGGRND